MKTEENREEYFAVVAVSSGEVLYPVGEQSGNSDIMAAQKLDPGTVHGSGSTRGLAIRAAKRQRVRVLAESAALVG